MMCRILTWRLFCRIPGPLRMRLGRMVLALRVCRRSRRLLFLILRLGWRVGGGRSDGFVDHFRQYVLGE